MMNQPRQIGDYLTAVDPTRGAMSASYAVVPGGPQNNNPNNAISVTGGPNTYKFAYGDLELQNDPRTAQVMPYPVSQKPQQMVTGQGYNRNTEMIQQPPPRMGDQMEAEYNQRIAQMKGLIPSPMGAMGLPAQPAPGGVTPSVQQAPDTLPLQTPNPEMAAQGNQMAKMNQGNQQPGMRA